MAISKKMIERGKAVGLSPEEGESSQSFSYRIRQLESQGSASSEPKKAQIVGRRGVILSE